MRLWKVVVVVALIAVPLAGATTARALRPPMQDGTLSVRDGRATMLVRARGSMIGRLAKGRLAVTNSPDGQTTVVVRGWENRVLLNDRSVVYSGNNIRFRISDDRRFSVKLSAKGLNFSVVGRGDGWIDGWGDPLAGVFFDGSYSLNGEEYHSLPDERTRFELAAPPTQ